MIARCYLYNSDVIDMLARDVEHVQQIAHDIFALQAQFLPTANMDQFGQVLKKVMPTFSESPAMADPAAEAFSALMDSAEVQTPKYSYTKWADGLPGALGPIGLAQVHYIEAFDPAAAPTTTWVGPEA